jgi:integrase
MSVYYSKTRKRWRYDFTKQGIRYTGTWLKTKEEAREAEYKRKEEIRNPKPIVEIPIDIDFLELVNKRLDYVKAYNSLSHYMDHISMGRKWISEWDGLKCGEISPDMIETYMIKRSKVSAHTANKDLRYLRALFNFGLQRKWCSVNPTQEIAFFPVEKKMRYIPSKEDISKVIMVASPSVKAYLRTLRETMGRMGEINRMTWEDVNFEERCVVLYTRKKRGGHLTPRKVPMTNKLFDVLYQLYRHRDKTVPWVFYRQYWDKDKKVQVTRPYQNRTKIMRTLCKEAGVKYFRFHAFRHFGASTLDRANVSIGSIQRILGHENRTTTEIYLHSIGEAEREAMAIFEKVTENPHTNSHTEEEIERKKDISILA